MKTKAIFFFLILVMSYVLAGCQTGTPASPAATTVTHEIILAPGQSASVTGTDLTLSFHSIVSDERCPREVECAASGPVTVSLSVQQGNDTPNDFTLQTFTDVNGRSPNVQFEGITNRAEVGDVVIQITGVTPYPIDSTTAIEASEYRVALVVSNK
jgi:hypothetical protein